MKKNILTFLGMQLFLCLICFSTHAQFSMTSYVNSGSSTAFAYQIGSRLKPEIRLHNQVLGDNSDADLEALVLLDVKKSDRYDFYLGAGVKSGGENQLMVPIGIQFRPITNLQNIGVIIEMASLYDGDLFLTNSFGIRYTFSKD